MLDNHTSGLNVIKVNKSDLGSVIFGNKQKHIAEYNEAMQGFKRAYKETLENLMQEAEYNDKHESSVFFDIPESHESDYETILEMLDMSVDEEIEISYSQFKRYVRDEWDWKQSFLTASAKYK